MAAPFNRCAVLVSARRKETDSDRQLVLSQAIIVIAYAEFTENAIKNTLRMWRRLSDKNAHFEPQIAAKLLSEFVGVGLQLPEPPNTVEKTLQVVFKKPTAFNMKTAAVALVPKEHKERFNSALAQWVKHNSKRLNELIQIRNDLTEGKVSLNSEINTELANLYLSDITRISRGFKAVLRDTATKILGAGANTTKNRRNQTPDADYLSENRTLVPEVLPKVKQAKSLPTSVKSRESTPWYMPKIEATLIQTNSLKNPGKIKKLKPVRLKLGEGYSDNSLEANENELMKRKKRCPFWPNCHKDEKCPLVHPSKKCLDFPFCSYGTECLYIHPNCRERYCKNQFCPYNHPFRPKELNFKFYDNIK